MKITTLALLLLVLPLSHAQDLFPRKREISFPFKGRTVYLSVSLSRASFNYYGDLPHTKIYPYPYHMALARYDPAARKLAARARALAEANGWDELDYITLLLYLTQYIPYNLDPKYTVGDYIRYPGETMMMTGDCEDKSLLAYGLLAAAGYDAVLVVFPPLEPGLAGHVLIGVHLGREIKGSHIDVDGKRYWLTEVSADRWALGRIAREYHFAEAEIHQAMTHPRSVRPYAAGVKRLGPLANNPEKVRAVIRPGQPLRVHLYERAGNRLVAMVDYPSELMAREVCDFYDYAENGTSHYFHTTLKLQSARIKDRELKLRWR